MFWLLWAAWFSVCHFGCVAPNHPAQRDAATPAAKVIHIELACLSRSLVSYAESELRLAKESATESTVVVIGYGDVVYGEVFAEGDWGRCEVDVLVRAIQLARPGYAVVVRLREQEWTV